ncbi:hypothetical protein O3G_MSEX005658 [Manduca sexta]|uniref:GTP-binding protein 1 n=3 Tax=Manduca sexta TaxID=7130 RepID=A0A921YZS4_MANSE|nr:hypothetical protein O3G_MSEX005658 [Manduca sexta]
MVMVSPALNPQACWQFEGEILVLHHPTTISSRYQAMVHCGSIRQTASILSMSRDCLRTGDKALVKFRFIKHPEYLKRGQRMVFREGRTKAVGNVLRPEPIAHKPAPAARHERHERHERRAQAHGTNAPADASTAHLQEADVTAVDSPFEVQADKRSSAAGGGGGGGGRRPRKRHDKPPDQPVAAN